MLTENNKIIVSKVHSIYTLMIYLLFLISIFSYSHLNWKEDLFLFTLFCLYVFGRMSKKMVPGLLNYFPIFLLIFLLSQFFINHFHPERFRWWFASIPGWLTVVIIFVGSVSLVSYQRIRVASRPIQNSDQTFNDLINKALQGIILVSLAMFFLFVLNTGEISPQEKLVPDYSMYIIIASGFVLFYSLNFSLKYLSLKKMNIFLKPAALGVLILLVGIGGIKIYIGYAAYFNTIHSEDNLIEKHSESEEKLWLNILELNKVPRIGLINIKAMNELGKINMEKGNFREAANYYKKILADQAFNFEANRGLAEVAYKQKEWGKAHEAYKKVIFLRPRERNLYSPYIHALIKDDKIDNVLEFIRDLKETLPTPLEETEDYLIIGEGFFKKGRTQEAITYLHRATEFMPRNYKAYLLLGRAYLESRQYTDGCEALERALQLNPKFAEGYYYLESGYENINQLHKAIKTFERLVLIDNKDIRAFYHLERLYKKVNLQNKAIEVGESIERTATKVIEPVDWKGRSGENVYQNGDMPWTGTMSAPILLKEGNAKFTLEAQGTPAKGIWPHMVVNLDNEIIGEVDVTTEKLKEYEFKKTVKPGKSYLSVTFTNDLCLADVTGKIIEDRNLFVRRCWIVYE